MGNVLNLKVVGEDFQNDSKRNRQRFGKASLTPFPLTRNMNAMAEIPEATVDSEVTLRLSRGQWSRKDGRTQSQMKVISPGC